MGFAALQLPRNGFNHQQTDTRSPGGDGLSQAPAICRGEKNKHESQVVRQRGNHGIPRKPKEDRSKQNVCYMHNEAQERVTSLVEAQRYQDYHAVDRID
jgi:hypothetical protein